MTLQDRRLAIQFCQEELNMWRIAAKFVPQLLHNEQKQHRWKSAGNFNSSFKRIQTFFRRLSLAPSDLFLFPKMKIKLKGRGSDTVEENQAKRRRY
jgi:hypothetical protein